MARERAPTILSLILSYQSTTVVNKWDQRIMLDNLLSAYCTIVVIPAELLCAPAIVLLARRARVSSCDPVEK